nr:reverse transcriptase domain-containing protein [Tanacetum cinerariifolium]
IDVVWNPAWAFGFIGGGTGRQVGREGRRVREPGRRKVKPTGEPEGQRNDQGVKVNEGVDGVPDFSMIIAQQLQNLLPTMLTQGDVRNVIVSNGIRGCTYKEFLACNPKEYNGKRGAIVYTLWIEKMESVQDMSGSEANQKVKYTAGSFVDKAFTWWNSVIHT